jgi:hypothetical protein
MTMTPPEWIAASATLTGALMTGSNVGTRVTGWGFVVFAVGSVAWVSAGLLNDQPSLIVTNGALLLVNLFGAWRWLGRKSRYEDSSSRAAKRSRRAPAPTLFPAGALIGASVQGPGEAARGTVVEAMLNCKDRSLAYVVIGEGGVGGAGETLRVLAPQQLRLQGDRVNCDLDDAGWQSLPVIEDDRWPATPPAAGGSLAASTGREGAA